MTRGTAEFTRFKDHPRSLSRGYGRYFMIILVSLSLIAPMAILYYVDAPSFDKTWKGRTFYMFFAWLFAMELILDWGKFMGETENKRYSALRLAVVGIVAVLPSIYVSLEYFFGLNAMINELALLMGVSLAKDFPSVVPLSIEYLVFAAFFSVIFILAYGLGGFKDFSISISLLVVIGITYAIDNAYPQGQFTPFQSLVPATASLAAWFLNQMGYQTTQGFFRGMTYLRAYTRNGPSWGANIAWPCSGVESLLIYTIVMLLFLKRGIVGIGPTKSPELAAQTSDALDGSQLGKAYIATVDCLLARKTDSALRLNSLRLKFRSFAASALKLFSFLVKKLDAWKVAIACFTLGAIVTYIINALRIVTLFLIGLSGGNIWPFHDYYGPLYSIIWITTYPLILIGVQILWNKIRPEKTAGRRDLTMSETRRQVLIQSRQESHQMLSAMC